jgi:HemY protein
MLRLFIFLFFLIASVWFGIEVMQHPGYVFIVYQPWMVQMPLWLCILGLIFGFGILYIIFNSVERLQFLWYRIKSWLRFRREHRYFSKTQQGLTMLIEGRWKKAERFLLAGVNQSVEPLINYLGAAKAAHEQKAYERRDRYIRQAYEAEPNADLAIGFRSRSVRASSRDLESFIRIVTASPASAPFT